jgi:O-succinylbenzoic acid--CoA ligase
MFKIPLATLSAEQLLQLSKAHLAEEPEAWEKDIWQFVSNIANPNIEFIEVKTSGSTGSPKIIKHHREAIFNSAKMTCEALQLKPGNNALLCLPANKIGGMMMIARSFYNQMDLLCIKPSSTPLSEMPDNVEIDFAAFTPMQFHEITGSYALYRKAQIIPKVILGSQPVGGNMLSYIRNFKTDVYSTFAMTETVSHFALKKLSGDTPDKYYNTLPAIEVSANEAGCLIVRAPSLGQPNLATNDLVNIISPTQFEWIGRIDNVINSGGIKIYPEEIEQRLLPEIEPAFFIASIPDEKTGEKLVLVMEAETISDSDLTELKQLLQTLDKFQRPKQLLLIKPFIRTETGKIKRMETLQEPFYTIVLQNFPT